MVEGEETSDELVGVRVARNEIQEHRNAPLTARNGTVNFS